MQLTHEKLDELERQMKEALDDIKASQQRDADRMRLLLTTISALRGGIVLERNKGAL